jgi:hypothetical protein
MNILTYTQSEEDLTLTEDAIAAARRTLMRIGIHLDTGVDYSTAQAVTTVLSQAEEILVKSSGKERQMVTDSEKHQTEVLVIQPNSSFASVFGTETFLCFQRHFHFLMLQDSPHREESQNEIHGKGILIGSYVLPFPLPCMLSRLYFYNSFEV